MTENTKRITDLDWMSLVEQTENAYAWLQSLLLTGQAEITLEPRSIQEKTLWHFYNEQRSARRLEGRQVLFFRYPYLIEKSAGKTSQTPLLRWPCSLEPPVNTRRYWLLKTTLPAAGQVNHALLTALEEHCPKDWQQLLAACLEPTEEALQKLGLFAQTLAENTSYISSSSQPALANMPQAELLTADTSELWWSASLGLEFTSWDDRTNLPTHWHQPFTHEESAIGNLSLSRLSPSQYHFFKQVHGERYALAEGYPDAGLSTTSLELIKLALAQGKSCLVISRKKANLENLSQQFGKVKSLDGFSLLWQDQYTDLPIVKGLITSFEKQKSAVSTYDPLRWRTALSRSSRLQRQYDDWFEASRKKIFGGQSWSDLLGFYLHFSRGEGKELLSSQLNATHFAFNPQEYREISAALGNTRPLYHQLGTLHHPLNNLSAAIFIHQDLEESKTFIQSTSQKQLTLARQLHQRYVRTQSHYADQLAGYHEARYLQLRTLLENLEQRLEDGQNTYGTDTLRSGDRTLKLYGRFSKKYDDAYNEKNALQSSYQELKALHEQLEPFPFTWPDHKPNRILDGLETLLRSFRKTMETWRNTMLQGVQEEMIRLNFKTAIPDLEASAGIEILERDLEMFIDEVNASGLYQLPLQSKTLTLSRQQKYLEEIIDQLEQSQEGLLQYEEFYHWQRNWFSLSEISRKTIQALLRSRPDDWDAAFSSWYFNECLQQHYKPFSPLSTANKEQYMEEVEQLRAQLPAFIQQDWAARRTKAYQRLKSALRTWPNDLPKLLEQYGSHLVTFFPVSFANPEVGAALADHYDLVVLDKAQDLNVSETAQVLAQAKQLGVIAASDQLALAKDSVIQYLKQGDIPKTFCTDGQVPNLAERWNSRQPTVHFHQVDGRFSEEEKTNEVEAQELLKLLNSIEKQGLKTYPRVGIITLTANQRDLLQQLLYRIKKERSPGAELVQQLERNGLTILQAEEALAQRFEVVIYSPVYGPVDHKGHLTSLLPALNKGRARASLMLLQKTLSRAQTVHVLNSLPLDEIKVRQAWSDRPGEQLHAYLIGLANAYSASDFAALDELQQTWPQSISKRENSDSLARELIYRLRSQLPGWKWDFTNVRGIQEEVILAKSPNGAAIVLLTDGFVAQGKATTLDWENWQKDRLRLSGYQILSFSSEELWKSPGMTAHRLASQLKGLAAKGEEE